MMIISDGSFLGTGVGLSTRSGVVGSVVGGKAVEVGAGEKRKEG